MRQSNDVGMNEEAANYCGSSSAQNAPLLLLRQCACTPNARGCHATLGAQSECRADRETRVTCSKLQWFALHRHQRETESDRVLPALLRLLQPQICVESRRSRNEFQSVLSLLVSRGILDECRHERRGEFFFQVESELTATSFILGGEEWTNQWERCL